MPRPDPRNWLDKCPDPPKHVCCDVCGSKYLCLETWRKKRTVDQRKKAYLEAQRAKVA